ncbi:MAG TPA: ATP-binding cassette domain-containing protein [Chthoniobacteraceae bacterium]|nr:ATP-binding cassette domain-containing protein [Chthoniobacteraceae bacterium]
MNVRLEGVAKRYGGTMALDLAGKSLNLCPGRIIAVVGLNGAGKSTLLHAIAGLLNLQSGTIFFDDEPFERDRVDQRQRFAFLPDFPTFFEGMTPLQHIAMVLRLYEKDGPGSEEKVLGLLKDFSLPALARTPLSTLSRGQRYKAALVALLAAEPELLLLDEPLASGMDGLGLGAFRRHARQLTENGGTVVYTTQILPVAETFSDEVIILHEGRVDAHDAFERLRQAEGDDLEALLQKLQ